MSRQQAQSHFRLVDSICPSKCCLLGNSYTHTIQIQMCKFNFYLYSWLHVLLNQGGSRSGGGFANCFSTNGLHSGSTLELSCRHDQELAKLEPFDQMFRSICSLVCAARKTKVFSALSLWDIITLTIQTMVWIKFHARGLLPRCNILNTCCDHSLRTHSLHTDVTPNRKPIQTWTHVVYWPTSTKQTAIRCARWTLCTVWLYAAGTRGYWRCRIRELGWMY